MDQASGRKKLRIGRLRQDAQPPRAIPAADAQLATQAACNRFIKLRTQGDEGGGVVGGDTQALRRLETNELQQAEREERIGACRPPLKSKLGGAATAGMR